ncbi:MAG TPA: hypothetical protein QF772_00230, partial [Nitrospinaceae bacterium]|nr:hypothetical protein [Nitrospinaceae bacterium]
MGDRGTAGRGGENSLDDSLHVTGDTLPPAGLTAALSRRFQWTIRRYRVYESVATCEMMALEPTAHFSACLGGFTHAEHERCLKRMALRDKLKKRDPPSASNIPRQALASCRR